MYYISPLINCRYICREIFNRAGVVASDVLIEEAKVAHQHRSCSDLFLMLKEKPPCHLSFIMNDPELSATFMIVVQELIIEECLNSMTVPPAPHDKVYLGNITPIYSYKAQHSSTTKWIDTTRYKPECYCLGVAIFYGAACTSC